MKQLSSATMIGFLLFSALAILPTTAFSQAGVDRNFEERYRILNSKLELLLESQQSITQRQQELESRLEALAREISRAKEDDARSSLQTVTREELKSLVEKMQEIDRKREDDKRLILDSIKQLAKLPAGPVQDSKPDKVDDGEKLKHTVRPGEYLFLIISAYNEEFKSKGLKSINIDDIKRANPDLNPDLVREGQAVSIPIPKKR